MNASIIHCQVWATCIGCESNDLQLCWLSCISDYSFDENTGLTLEATNFIAINCLVVMVLFGWDKWWTQFYFKMVFTWDPDKNIKVATFWQRPTYSHFLNFSLEEFILVPGSLSLSSFTHVLFLCTCISTDSHLLSSCYSLLLKLFTHSP